MKAIAALFAALLLAVPVLAKEAAPLAQDPAVEQRMINITNELRCLVCQNESLAASQAELAGDLRNEVRELIKQGKTDQQVKDYLVARYGDFVLYRPPVKPSTWLLWAGPFLFLAVGVGALVAFLRRRGRQVAEATLTDDEKTRAEALLKADQ